MDLRFIRPEDRRRSGGSGGGSGVRTEWSDTVPAMFRSEAFAEDLAPGFAGDELSRVERLPAAAPASRGRRAWVPMLGIGLAAALGLGSTLRD